MTEGYTPPYTATPLATDAETTRFRRWPAVGGLRRTA